jgi:hypothetical protein
MCRFIGACLAPEDIGPVDHWRCNASRHGGNALMLLAVDLAGNPRFKNWIGYRVVLDAFDPLAREGLPVCLAASGDFVLAQAARYGAETAVLDWKKRLVCGKCDSRNIDLMGERWDLLAPDAPPLGGLRARRRATAAGDYQAADNDQRLNDGVTIRCDVFR